MISSRQSKRNLHEPSPPTSTSRTSPKESSWTRVRLRNHVSLLSFAWIYFFCIRTVNGFGVYTDCGGHLEGPHGIIQTPNFPDPFPIPISCRWIIRTANTSRIAIYFTQYFLRHSFFVSEYDYYASPQDYHNKNTLGEINAEDMFTSIVAYRNYVTLDLIASDASNLHLRVEDYIRDVHGFNITYVVIPKGDKVSNSACSSHDCSHLGNCLVSADYSQFMCKCFDGFYGQYCEKGPHCDPEKGKNMCLNGGNCSYFLGSLVNVCTCPPRYTGLKCEHEIVNSYKAECQELKCSHYCDLDQMTGVLQCACNRGFRLDADKVTCVEEERYRITVQLPVVEQEHLTDNLDEVHDNINSVIAYSLHWLHLSGFETVTDFNLDYLSDTSIGFHYYIDKTEIPLVLQATSNLIHRDQFFGVSVNASKMIIQKAPDVKLLSVENSDQGPVFEGKLMMLTCTARGSDKLRFKWYKDGESFNMTRTHRNAWEILLPETLEEKRISVLNIDGVTTYDKGEFTCEISDHGQKMNGSVLFDILPYPQVEVSPLSVSVVKGNSQTFRCLAPDGNDRSYTYSWSKNNRTINEADEEIVEDLLPSGSRLLITKARVSTNYTCRITNRAGTSTQQVYMFVIDVNASTKSCPSSAFEGVKWNRTFGGFFNLQKCPTDAAGVFVRGVGDGYTKRRCICENSNCYWGPPNYAQCQSVHLIEIYDKLMKIQLGYQQNVLMETFHKLYDIVKKASGKMFAGDLDITAKNLHMAVTITRDFPSLATEEFKMESLVDFLHMLLQETVTKTLDEKQELLVGRRILQVAEIMVELASAKLLNLTDTHTGNIDAHVIWMQPEGTTVVNKIEAKGGEQKSTKPYHTQKPGPVVNERRRRMEESDESWPYQVLKFQYDQTILPLLDNGHPRRGPEETCISDVYSYILLSSPMSKTKDYYIIDIAHSVHLPKHNTSCFIWRQTKNTIPRGKWTNDACTTVETSINNTRCRCLLPGHFTVVATPVNETVTVPDGTPSHIVLIIATVISFSFMFVAFGVYLLSWRYLREEKHNIHFNFVISVLGINLICILCFAETQPMCIAGRLFLQLFTMSAFTFLLLDAIQLFTDISARTGSRVVVGARKFFLIGWGVPLLSVISVVLVMEVAGYDEKCTVWCWWTPSHHHFYSILIPVVILIVGHTVMLTFCIVMISRWKDEWRFRHRRKSLLELARSEILLVLLLIFIICGVKYDDENAEAGQAVFMLFSISTAVTTMLFLVVFKKPMRLSVRSACIASKSSAHKMTLSGLRAFILPGNEAAHARAEIERIHEYCDRVDRERYTNEHKRQLRFLLNSSSSSGSSGAATNQSGSQSNSQGACDMQHLNNEVNIDSGISEGTDSEKSTMAQPRKEESHPAIASKQNKKTKSGKQRHSSARESCVKTLPPVHEGKLPLPNSSSSSSQTSLSTEAASHQAKVTSKQKCPLLSENKQMASSSKNGNSAETVLTVSTAGEWEDPIEMSQLLSAETENNFSL